LAASQDKIKSEIQPNISNYGHFGCISEQYKKVVEGNDKLKVIFYKLLVGVPGIIKPLTLFSPKICSF